MTEVLKLSNCRLFSGPVAICP